MGIDSNGSTPKRFDHGLPLPDQRVRDSLVWQTEPGRMFVSECLDRHVTGDHGEIPDWLQETNRAFASNQALAAGGSVLGAYEVPEALRLGPDQTWLVVITTAEYPFDSLPDLGILTTLLLFRS